MAEKQSVYQYVMLVLPPSVEAQIEEVKERLLAHPSHDVKTVPQALQELFGQQLRDQHPHITLAAVESTSADRVLEALDGMVPPEAPPVIHFRDVTWFPSFQLKRMKSLERPLVKLDVENSGELARFQQEVCRRLTTSGFDVSPMYSRNFSAHVSIVLGDKGVEPPADLIETTRDAFHEVVPDHNGYLLSTTPDRLVVQNDVNGIERTVQMFSRPVVDAALETVQEVEMGRPPSPLTRELRPPRPSTPPSAPGFDIAP
jgi:2'-5' RNA ligase